MNTYKVTIKKDESNPLSREDKTIVEALNESFAIKKLEKAGISKDLIKSIEKIGE